MRNGNNHYPEGDALQRHIKDRRRRGLGWRLAFQIATIIGIIALLALLYNILTQAFGLVAVENEVDPDGLVQEYYQAQMFLAPNTQFRAEANELIEGIREDPLAIGFVNYASLQGNEVNLRQVDVEAEAGIDVAANAQDDVLLQRPLFLYTSETVLQARPEVAAFTAYYLQHVNDVIQDSGYLNVDEATLAETERAYLEATGQDALPAIDPAAFSGTITVAAPPGVQQLAQQIADRFIADGFQGDVTVEEVANDEALRQLCTDASVDVINLNRQLDAIESVACMGNDPVPVELRVGTEALAVVTHPENGFVSTLNESQLEAVFTTAERWSEIDASWPDEPIHRYIPGPESDTLQFFTQSLFDVELADLPKEVLVGILSSNVSEGLARRLEHQQRFFDDYLVFTSVQEYVEACSIVKAPEGCRMPGRSQENVYQLVLEHVIQPDVVQTWSLVDSVLRQAEIAAQVQQDHPEATVEFRSWLTPSFITAPQSPEPELAGVRTAILGSLWVILITMLFSFPVGVGAAIYLEEYASDNWLNRLIQTNINNLAGVPSIIYGMLGLAIFVRTLEAFSSGAAFGVTDSTTANGRTILAAGLTLGLLILPILIINAQEAIRAVPNSLRQASYGLGATKWQTIWAHVIPNALPGILTGTILSMSRAIGETAPLIVVGASTFITADPEGPFSQFTVLPIQIFQWTSRPQGEFRNIAAAAIVVLLILLLSLNAGAVLLRNRFSKRLA